MFINIRNSVIYGKNAADASRKVGILLNKKDNVLLKSIGLKVYSKDPSAGALYKYDNTALDPTVSASIIDKNIVAIFEVSGTKELLEIPLGRPASIITYMENNPALAQSLGFNINVGKDDLFNYVNNVIVRPLLNKGTLN